MDYEKFIINDIALESADPKIESQIKSKLPILKSIAEDCINKFRNNSKYKTLPFKGEVKTIGNKIKITVLLDTSLYDLKNENSLADKCANQLSNMIEAKIAHNESRLSIPGLYCCNVRNYHYPNVIYLKYEK